MTWMRTPRNRDDVLFKYLADSLGDSALSWMGVENAEVVAALPTEQPILELRGNFLDTAFLTAEGVLLHFEYQKTKEPDLYRFLQYDAYLTGRWKRQVRTVVLYEKSVVNPPQQLDAGYLKYQVDIVLLRERDGLAAMRRMEQHLGQGMWTVQDRLDAAFLPYMQHKGWSRRQVVAKTAELVQAIGDAQERNRTTALLLLISAKNLSDDAVERLKEGLTMTDVVKIIGREEHARGLAEGREAGREEGLVEMAGKLLASGMEYRAGGQICWARPYAAGEAEGGEISKHPSY